MSTTFSDQAVAVIDCVEVLSGSNPPHAIELLEAALDAMRQTEREHEAHVQAQIDEKLVSMTDSQLFVELVEYIRVNGARDALRLVEKASEENDYFATLFDSATEGYFNLSIGENERTQS